MKGDSDLILLIQMISSLIITAIILFSISYIFCGCTYSINMVHTQGEATDLIDETQRADPDIKADLSIPAI